ncbi:MAG: hypothetical protein K8W52_06370 [Deltaproteobacteria bacterium]|nr:hypothetical protein [Deltaproteobacteria bacterium]
MKKPMATKKLQLDTQTIRELDTREAAPLAQVVGGKLGNWYSRGSYQGVCCA